MLSKFSSQQQPAETGNTCFCCQFFDMALKVICTHRINWHIKCQKEWVTLVCGHYTILYLHNWILAAKIIFQLNLLSEFECL